MIIKAKGQLLLTNPVIMALIFYIDFIVYRANLSQSPFFMRSQHLSSFFFHTLLLFKQ